MRKLCRNKKKGHVGFGLAMLGILSSNLFISGCAGNKVLPPKISNGIEQIAEHKSKAEQSALTIKTNWAKGSKEYKKGEALYTDAKAAFDGWIERLRFDLLVGNDIKKSEHYRKSLRETANKSKALLSYATKASARPLTAEPLGMMGALSDAGIKIWKEYRAAQKEKRDEILEFLAQLKWKNFKDVK